MTTSQSLWLMAGPVAGYLLGSIPFGVILSSARGVDLRNVGSGNVGATNVGRALGRRWGYLCFLLDLLKGFGPTFLAGWAVGAMTSTPTLLQQATWLAVGAGCILGHVFSLFLRFRGGKGVATSLGVVLGVWPYYTLAGLCALGVWVVVVLISRYVSLASILAAVMFVPLMVLFNLGRIQGLWLMVGFAAVFCSLVILRHRTNIRRLLTGTENQIGRQSTPPTPNGNPEETLS